MLVQLGFVGTVRKPHCWFSHDATQMWKCSRAHEANASFSHIIQSVITADVQAVYRAQYYYTCIFFFFCMLITKIKDINKIIILTVRPLPCYIHNNEFVCFFDPFRPSVAVSRNLFQLLECGRIKYYRMFFLCVLQNI